MDYLLYRRRLLCRKNIVGKTTLYADGTFIINEYAEDRASNILLHGVVTNEYYSLDETHPYVFSTTGQRPWNNQRKLIKYVEFGSNVIPTNMSRWFYGCSNLISFNSLNLNTSNATSIDHVFTECTSLTNIDVSSWDTTNVTSIEGIFRGSSLINIDLSTFNGSNINKFTSAFENCANLTSLNLFTDDTVFLTSLNSNSMLATCPNLSSVKINGTNILRATAASTLYQLKSTCKFYVPNSLVNSYKSALNWSTRSSYIYAQS